MAFSYDRLLHFNGDVSDIEPGSPMGPSPLNHHIYAVVATEYNPAYRSYNIDDPEQFPDGRTTVYLRFANEEDFHRWNPTAIEEAAAMKRIGSHTATGSKKRSHSSTKSPGSSLRRQ